MAFFVICGYCGDKTMYPGQGLVLWDVLWSCWRHQMRTFSALLAICAGNSPVTGEFPSQRPVTRSFDVIFDLRLNKRLSKQSWGWWFETPSRPLWRHCHVSHAFPGRMLFSNTSSYSDVTWESRRLNLPTVCSTSCSGLQQKKHRSFTLLALCDGNLPLTDGFPSQRASNAESVSISWRHHAGKNLNNWPHLFDAVTTNNKENIVTPHYWPFVMGIHRWPMDSPHKGPVMLKAFPYHEDIMLERNWITALTYLMPSPLTTKKTS